MGTWVDFHTAAIVVQAFCDSVPITECQMPREGWDDLNQRSSIHTISHSLLFFSAEILKLKKRFVPHNVAY